MTDFQPLRSELGPVADRFEEAGHQLHLVGGVVRDLLLGGDPIDIDLTTDAMPEVTRRLVAPLADAMWVQGERFGTIGARVAGRDLEITTYRKEAYVGESRKPEVTFGDDLATDLSRRDFTINAMAVSVSSGELVDPYGGVADLAARALRTPLDPTVSFSDDPLRILRAARFIPRFDLTVTPEISAAASALSHRLSIVSAERKRDELERLLILPTATPGLVFLGDHGVFDDVIPELGSGWSAAVALAVRSADARVRRAGLLFGLGAQGARERMMALTYSKSEVDATGSVVGLVDQILASDASDRSVRTLVAAAGARGEPELVDAALTLAALVGPSAAAERVEAALEHLRTTEDLTKLGGPLSGEQVMDLLGLDPGPAVGAAMDLLRQHRIDIGPYDEAAAIEFLKTAGPHGDSTER